MQPKGKINRTNPLSHKWSLAYLALIVMMEGSLICSAAKSFAHPTFLPVNSLRGGGDGDLSPSISWEQIESNGNMISDDQEEELLQTNFIADTNLPTDIGQFRLRAYRVCSSTDKDAIGEFVGKEPCVIYSKDHPPGKLKADGKNEYCVPVRIHDQCFTSEVFRSQRCDCKEQLVMAMKYIQKHGGAIIYLQQEGRGIGIANKVAAYALQDSGMDTVDANLHLGFPEDARQYGVVPSILKDMGINSIQLMTNNPRKIHRLTKLGVNVSGTVPMVVPKPTKYNRKYLETKQERMSHQNFDDMLTLADTDIDDINQEEVVKGLNVIATSKRINAKYSNKSKIPTGDRIKAGVTYSDSDSDSSETDPDGV